MRTWAPLRRGLRRLRVAAGSRRDRRTPRRRAHGTPTTSSSRSGRRSGIAGHDRPARALLLVGPLRLAVAVAARVARAVALGGRGQRRGGRRLLAGSTAGRLGAGVGRRRGRLHGLGLLLGRRAGRLALGLRRLRRVRLAGRRRRLGVLLGLAVLAGRALGLPAVPGVAAVAGLGRLLGLLARLLLGLAGGVGARGRVLGLARGLVGLGVLAVALGLAGGLVGPRAGLGSVLLGVAAPRRRPSRSRRLGRRGFGRRAGRRRRGGLRA